MSAATRENELSILTSEIMKNYNKNKFPLFTSRVVIKICKFNVSPTLSMSYDDFLAFTGGGIPQVPLSALYQTRPST